MVQGLIQRMKRFLACDGNYFEKNNNKETFIAKLSCIFYIYNPL